MAHVKVKMEAHAKEATLTEVLQSAAAAMPGSEPKAAQVVRDANGKLIEVDVVLPDGDVPGLENAKAAINANAGVSKASGFPLTIANDDLDSLSADGSVLATTSSPYAWDGGTGNSGLVKPIPINISESVVSAAYSSESKNGTGSAFMIQPRSSTAAFQNSSRTHFSFNGVLNGFDPVQVVEYEFDLIIPGVINGNAIEPDIGFDTTIYVGGITGSAGLEIRLLNGTSDWRVWNFEDPSIQTGVNVGYLQSFKIRASSQPGSLSSIEINGNTFTLPVNSAYGLQDNLELVVLHLVNFSTSAARTGDECRPVIMDNLKMKILA